MTKYAAVLVVAAAMLLHACPAHAASASDELMGMLSPSGHCSHRGIYCPWTKECLCVGATAGPKCEIDVYERLQKLAEAFDAFQNSTLAALGELDARVAQNTQAIGQLSAGQDVILRLVAELQANFTSVASMIEQASALGLTVKSVAKASLATGFTDPSKCMDIAVSPTRSLCAIQGRSDLARDHTNTWCSVVRDLPNDKWTFCANAGWYDGNSAVVSCNVECFAFTL